MIESKSASSSANDVSIDALDARVAGAHLAAHLDAVAVGQPHIDDRDVGFAAGMRASASAAVDASPTTSRSSSTSSSSRTPRRTIS